MAGIFQYKKQISLLYFMSILKHSGSNYGMENNVTSQITGSFTSDCVKIMGLGSLVGKKGKGQG